MVMAIGILSCLLFLVAIRKVVLSEAIKLVEWEIHNVLVNDYSVEL